MAKALWSFQVRRWCQGASSLVRFSQGYLLEKQVPQTQHCVLVLVENWSRERVEY